MTEQERISPNDSATIHSRYARGWRLSELTQRMAADLQRLERDNGAKYSPTLGLVDVFGRPYFTHTVKGLIARGLIARADGVGNGLVITKAGRECVERSR